MLKVLFILLFTTFATAESWWDKTDHKPFLQQRDNQAHIAVCGAASAIVSYYLVKDFNMQKRYAALIGFTVGSSVGIIKELSDKNIDSNDLKASMLGAGIGAIPVFVWRF